VLYGDCYVASPRDIKDNLELWDRWDMDFRAEDISQTNNEDKHNWTVDLLIFLIIMIHII
jgi:hypothetical protein